MGMSHDSSSALPLELRFSAYFNLAAVSRGQIRFISATKRENIKKKFDEDEDDFEDGNGDDGINPFLSEKAKASLEDRPRLRSLSESTFHSQREPTSHLIKESIGLPRFQGEKPERKKKWIIEKNETKQPESTFKIIPSTPAAPPRKDSSAPNLIAAEGEVKLCKGCGAQLQTSEPKKLGYIPPERLNGPQIQIPDSLDNEALRSILSYRPPPATESVKCQRCWKLEHYGVVVPIEVTAEDLMKELKHIKAKRALVVKIVDVFDFDGTFIQGFRRFSGGNPVILLVNKIDLLPADVSLERIEKWVRSEAKSRGLEIADVFLVSAFTGLNLRRVAESIHEHRADRDVFIMGLSNVGKSSIVNKLWPLLRPDAPIKKHSHVTVSNVPGTTVSTVGLAFSDGFKFFDTPGIMPEDGLTKAVPLQDYLKALPKKRIYPRLKHVRRGETIFIGGYARIDFVRGPSYVNLLVYASAEVDVEQMLTEEADAAFEQRIYDPISSPFRNRELLLSDRKVKRPFLEPQPPRNYNCSEGYNRATVDLVFAGLGWVAVAAKDQVQLRCWYLPNCLVSERAPLMPYDIVKKRK